MAFGVPFSTVIWLTKRHVTSLNQSYLWCATHTSGRMIHDDDHVHRSVRSTRCRTSYSRCIILM